MEVEESPATGVSVTSIESPAAGVGVEVEESPATLLPSSASGEESEVAGVGAAVPGDLSLPLASSEV